MSTEDDFLKPLSLGDEGDSDRSKSDEIPKKEPVQTRSIFDSPLSDSANNNSRNSGGSRILSSSYESPKDFVPLASNASKNDVINKDSNFVFFFGVSGCGKSVILSAMLYYMRSQAGVLRPKIGAVNTKEDQVLLTDFFENIRQGKLPERSARDKVSRMDLVFEPNNRSSKVQPVNLTFLDMNGEDLGKIHRGGAFIGEVENYLNSNIPLNFIIVTSIDHAHKDDVIINEFLDELERKKKNLKNANLILVISKWDLSGKTEVESSEELDAFIYERLPMTAQRIDTYGLSKTYFTIGEIENETGKIRILNLNRAEALSKWLYKSIVGYDLDYEGTFWERIKFSFSS